MFTLSDVHRVRAAETEEVKLEWGNQRKAVSIMGRPKASAKAVGRGRGSWAAEMRIRERIN